MLKPLAKFWEYGGGKIALAAICAHSTSISIGICQGYSAILLPQLKESEKYKDLSPDETSWIASLGTITNPIGSILSGVLAEYMGRRRAIQVTALPLILGWMCFGLAQNVNWLYAGRLITGIAAGMSPACYTYVGEISTSENRGFMQTLGPICASFGILLTYTLGYIMNYATVAYISIAFGLFSAVVIQLVPESPSYLLKHDRTSDAFNTLLWFRGNNAVAQQEIDRFHENQKESNSKNMTFKEMYFGPQTVKPFLILVGLFMLQEFSGIYTLLMYAVNFFKETHVPLNDYVASIIVGAIRFSMSVVIAYLINIYGRKTLCTMSSIGMALTMSVVAIYVKYYEIYPDKEKVVSYLPLIGVMLNVAFSMVGMLPVPWVMVGEMFPLKVRPIMSGIVVSLAQLLIFICAKIYINMNDALNFSGTLIVFVVASILAAVYSKTILTETKNKTLEEIEAHFRGNKKVCTVDDIEGVDNTGFDNSSEEVNKSDSVSVAVET
ncbi:facilitated trehalose transporter Tret1 isoform X1 [Diabrotica virgifera virgifera]|uniref:Facilitated trehalose transporter Tret1-like isoform X1 n=1 Tax=Diabrotica virgifera virgifera TaxID=50390 RepID=A0A6P7G6V8_DIAVI|nr:facilitated trehalose transporter Tret1 isoform X1 [Diabrotica virgifera virgifera]XP_050513228.1 facilitated trehalose transporter Tret1 isoform X1 [Diabrotica virgifera virgifera]